MSAQGLPAHILALFTPRPPPQHLPPQVNKRCSRLDGCAEFVEFFSTEKAPEREAWESPLEKKQRRHAEKLTLHKEAQAEMKEKYDPHKDPNASGDPFRTLFVARISFDTTEKKLKREFEVFGSIKKVRMVYDQKGKPRGYSFIEFEHERDLKNAYKQGDGKKIDGRRVMVDVERGRTVEGWMPRRLGGGRGPGRVGKAKKKKAAAARKEGDDKDKDRDRKDKDKDRDRRGDEKERDRKDDRKDRDRKDDRDRDRRGGDDRGRDRKDDRGDRRGGDDRGDRKRERSRSRDRGGDRDRDRRR